MTEQFADARDRYRLDHRIAVGGMGEVWRATDTTLDREVAIKLLKQEYAGDPVFRARFEAEARHAAVLSHPGIAAVFDVGEAPQPDGSLRPYLVMELVDGRPLSDLLHRGQALDPDAVRELLVQAADALAAAHRAGIVHRDVKPANLMVTHDRKIKITDFGIARAASGAAITNAGEVMGTPQYLSPEQARGDRVTPASDVYGLGVVAYECLTGRRPFEKETPVATALAHLHDPVPELPDTVPADLSAVVTRALAKDPADRYADAEAFAAALRSADGTATQVIAAPAAGPATAVLTGVVPAAGAAAGVAGAAAATEAEAPVEPEERKSRKKLWLWIAGIVLVLLIAFLGWRLLNGEDDRDPVAPAPSSDTPSPSESEEPTEEPTQEPTQEPTEEPTEEPTQEPTEEPTEEPTDEPTEEPTEEPTDEPTEEPTEEPTDEPTEEPTEEPTDEPTQATDQPTQAPDTSQPADGTDSPAASGPTAQESEGAGARPVLPDSGVDRTDAAAVDP
uniref:protein kinase domain-containing protein n=1 Tax=Nocardioides insulae TaxID=394734 RepID=UPI000686BFF6